MTQAVKWILAFLLLYSPGIWAISSFKIERIKLSGLQGIAASTVFNYLPVKEGEILTDDNSSEIIRVLFQTGFFNNIQLSKENKTLVIHFIERPAIANIKISGNDEISTEDLTTALKGIGLHEGRIFNRSLLEKVEQELQRQYFALGKYGVKIKSTLLPQERNRVAIDIEIDEGVITRIREINIVGNTAFSEEKLLSIFQSGAHSDWSVYTSDSQYSKQKLFADIELLRSYYMDRGYINFTIESTQVSITPDKSDVFITININEGGKFRVSNVGLSGRFVVPKEELEKFLTIKADDIFSRKKVSVSSTRITERLGLDGYAFANVNAQPDIDNENQTVGLTFFVDPGKRVYIRRVMFGGNVKTHDEVLRREMRQMEGGWFSTAKLERSKTRLFRTGFFEDINVETPLVAGRTDLVDIVITVTERPSGSIQASVGFGQGSGLILSGSVNQNNFLGTGNRIGAEISNNRVNTIYSFSLTDPYYTIDGISRSFRLYLRKTDASRASSIAGFVSDAYGGSMSFGFPLSEYYRASAGIGFDNTDFTLDPDSAPASYLDFERANQSSEFDTYTMMTSWTFDTRDRIVFAQSGLHTILSADVTTPGGDLQFYKISLRQQLFFTIIKNWTLHLEGFGAFARGYGKTDIVPFYEHYYAGGAQSVRGFRANSLGPREPAGARSLTIGGTKKLIGIAELLFPNPFAEESKSVRFSFFVDSGSVYGNDIGYDYMEYLRRTSSSYGFAFTWIAPIGALKFSWAWPLRTQPTDQTERFQFSIGAPF